MDKVASHSLCVDYHAWARDLQDTEPRSRRVYAGTCHADRKRVITSEPASLLILDHEDNPLPSKPLSGGLHAATCEDNWENLSLEKALALLEENPNGLPSIDNFIIVLRKCRKQQCTEYALRIHMHILCYGLDSHKIIGNHLVPMLVDCDRTSDAQLVFNRLEHRNEHAWTALLHGYVNSGDSENAVSLSESMLSDGVKPSRHTYVALLKACARLKCLGRGRELHAHIIEEHLENDLYIGNTLVDMYAKCGSLLEAQKVFDTMPLCDVVSWTALLGGYADHGLDQEALACLDRMRSENVLLNNVTFVCGLKACGIGGHVEKGQFLHAEIAIDGYEGDLHVGNALVDMYAKFRKLEEARFVFDNMLRHDDVSWNALIGGYVEQGLGNEALQCFSEMKKVGKSPNAITYIFSLKACGSMAALDKGKEIHAEIDRKGYGKNLLVGNALLDMYCRGGHILEAKMCFDKMHTRDVISWTTLMQGYVEHGLAEKALSCLKDMQKEGIHPDAVAYLLSIKACSSLGSLQKGQEIHAEIDREGYGADLVLGNSLVDMYIKCGSLKDAQEVFRKLAVRNVVSWTALISGYAEKGLGEDALKLFEQMNTKGISPNAFTYACSLKACSSMGAINKGRGIHGEVIVEGYEQDQFVGNSLVDMYAKLGLLKEAQEVLVELSTRDVVSWTALITGYTNGGFMETASKCFIQMQLEGITPESISYNPLIMGYSKKGEARKPLKLFRQMTEHCILADRVTFLSILKACANGSSLDTGRKIHAQILNLKAFDNSLACTLIYMYSKLGSMIDSQQVFDAMNTRDHVAWTALMTGYARQKENRHVLRLFEQMRQEGVCPDGITFVVVIKACRAAKLVDEGQKYFEMMTKEYGITPTTEHQDNMVDLLEKAGRVDEAVAIIL